MPFRDDVFEPFVADVGSGSFARAAHDRASPRGTRLGARVDSLLRPSGSRRAALVTLGGVSSVDALRELAAASGVTLLDVRQASESLVARQRSGILRSLGSRSCCSSESSRWRCAAAPRAARARADGDHDSGRRSALSAFGFSLTLFHLDLADVGRRVSGWTTRCFSSTRPTIERSKFARSMPFSRARCRRFMVFALLAMSTLPVLRAIGLPVAIGVVSNFFLSMFLAAPRAVTRS